jgi:hypothetical protein
MQRFLLSFSFAFLFASAVNAVPCLPTFEQAA